MLPTIAFTSNPAFDPELGISPKLKTLMRDKNVHSWQIVHMKTIHQEADAKNFVAEHKALTTHALLLWSQHPSIGIRHHENLKILTDAGNSFKDEYGSIFEHFGWEMGWEHCTFIPCVHHFFSTLDNGANSTVKKKYLALMHDSDLKPTEAEGVVFMVSFADDFTPDQIHRFWRRNFFLDFKGVASITDNDIKQTFFKDSRKNMDYHLYCDEIYSEYAKNKAHEESMPVIGSPNRYDYSQNGRKALAPSTRKPHTPRGGALTN